MRGLEMMKRRRGEVVEKYGEGEGESGNKIVMRVR